MPVIGTTVSGQDRSLNGVIETAVHFPITQLYVAVMNKLSPAGRLRIASGSFAVASGDMAELDRWALGRMRLACLIRWRWNG
jgi:hypothetical protein